MMRYRMRYRICQESRCHLQMFVSCLGPLADWRKEENINQGGVELRSHGQHKPGWWFAEFDHRVNPTSVLITHAFSSSDWFPSLKYWRSMHLVLHYANVYEMVSAKWSMEILRYFKWNNWIRCSIWKTNTWLVCKRNTRIRLWVQQNKYWFPNQKWKKQCLAKVLTRKFAIE